MAPLPEFSSVPKDFIQWDPSIWGPHFWFFLHTITFTYPNFPNAITKKKYYEFVQNIPMFLPVEEIATSFSHLLNEFPIQPYLENKESFIKWMWFIHNKINEKLEKPTISLPVFHKKYFDLYKSESRKKKEYLFWKKKIVSITILLLLFGILIYLYKLKFI